MRVGFYETVITPPLGLEMAGYFSNRLAEGVIDDLYSRALVVSQGDNHVALLVTDLIHVPYHDVQKVRELVAARTPIPAANVMVAATHTHTGPTTAGRPGSRSNEEYMQTWAERSAEAVAQAFERRVPAKIGGGVGNLTGLSFNRRFWMKNGVVHTNPGIGNPDVVEPAGPIDTQVTVLRFDDLDGKPLGVLTNFSCHTDTVGGNKYSADWVGVAVRSIRRLVAELNGVDGEIDPNEFGVIVVNGACGEINHHDVFSPERRKQWPSMTQSIGVGLAAETIRVALGISPQNGEDQPVRSDSRMLELPRIPVDEWLKACEDALADERVGRMERVRAESALKAAERFRADDRATEDVEVQVLQIGPAAILGLPGEIFSESGLLFKSQAPQAFPMIANLANGSLGYIPSYRAYPEGGYESRSARLQPGSVEEMIAAGIQLARQGHVS